MQQALCLCDIGVSWLRSAGYCTTVLRHRRAASVANTATTSSSSSTRRPPSFSRSSLSSPCPRLPPSLSVVSQRVCVRGPSRCNAAASTTQSVLGAAQHSPDAPVRACIHLRLMTDPPYVLSVRPLCSSHVRQHANRTRQK